MSSEQRKIDLLMRKARELAKSAPQKAAIILTEWLNRPAKVVKTQTTIKKKAG